MLGMEGVCELVAATLEQKMPAKVDQLRARYTDLDGDDLPYIGLYSRSQRARLERGDYPAIEVVPRDARRPVTMDTDGGVTFWFPYTIRIFLSVRGTSFENVDQRRKRLTLGVVELLASTPLLQAAPQAKIDVASIWQSFSAVSSSGDTDNRSVGAAFVEATVIVDEMTDTVTPLGHADTIVIHPALMH